MAPYIYDEVNRKINITFSIFQDRDLIKMPILIFSTTIVSSSMCAFIPASNSNTRNPTWPPGMKGISTNPEQVAVWIESIDVCSHLAMAMGGMYSSNAGHASAATTVKHKEEDRKRRELDRDDRIQTLA